MNEPGWYHDPQGQLRRWDGHQWGSPIPWAVSGGQPGFTPIPAPNGKPERHGLKITLIVILVIAGLCAAGLGAAAFFRADSETPRSVATRFVNDFMAAESCTRQAVTVVNEDTTDNYRQGATIDCSQLIFIPNPDGYALTVDEVSQRSSDKAVATVRESSALLERNSEYEIELVREHGRWLVDSVTQISQAAPVT